MIETRVSGQEDGAQPLVGAVEPPQSLRIESQAVYIALICGVVGAVAGLTVGLFLPPLHFSGDWAFGSIVAIAVGVMVAISSAIGYWRIRRMPGQEWRLTLPPATFAVNTIAVVLVHVVLAVLATLLVFLVLGMGFVGLDVDPFWAATLMAVAVGLGAYLSYLSVARMTTKRMSSLLLAFVLIGTVTAMATAPDPRWWETHFSHLGTFWSVSGLMFNGTLAVGGLLVTSFAVYLGNDLRTLVWEGVLARESAPTTISRMFVAMGIMLAGVGLVPVNLNRPIHNLCAMGLGIMFIGLLAGGRRILEGMPRAYFVASWAFLAAMLVSILLYAVGFFGLTAFEIVVFALVFGWITVFIRFLGVAGQDRERT